MTKFYTYTFSVLISALFLLSSCEKPDLTPNELVPSDDVRIGEAIDKELQQHSDTAADFTILDQNDFWKIYSYSDTIIRTLLNSGDFQYSSEFNWKIRIFDSPGIENSFAAPGGYIYVSRSLILGLEDEAQYAAVLAHIMKLSDMRTVTRKLEKRFTVSYLLDISIGGNVVAPYDVFEELKDIPYSAEEASMLDIKTADIICKSNYDIRSFAQFLAEADQQNAQGFIYEWLMLFPAAENRAETVFNRFGYNNCTGTMTNQTEFEKIKISVGR